MMEEIVDNKKRDLVYIINNREIKTVFQPIVSLLDGEILGHEALSRITCKNSIENIEMLFHAAEEYKCLWELETLCRAKAFETAYEHLVPPYKKKLFINVNPNTMHDENFISGFTKGFLEQYDIIASNVIFEITERNAINDMDRFRLAVDHYKGQDYRIAIDDAGSGYSGLNLISEVNPNYIKLDMKLIRDIDKDGLKYALVKGMVELSKVSNIKLIAEGIETHEELKTIIKLGVQYGQGYFIQKPEEEVKDIDERIIKLIRKVNLKMNEKTHSATSNIPIASLCRANAVISPDKKISEVYDLFKSDPDCFGICIVEDGIAIGTITQEKLSLMLSGQYGFALNQNKPVSQLMDREFLSVDHKTPINFVSSLAMARPNNKLYDCVVVTEEGQYRGTVTVKDLLLKTTEMEISMAKHQNPLTGLSGNVIIEQKLSQYINDEKEYSVAYLDIDNFKAYNDVYGFENGDLVLLKLANILKNEIPNEDFIGHVGGDDFVVILNQQVEVDYFKDITKKFEYEVLSLYNQEDLEQGYIITANRHGVIEKFPIITLTTVVTNNKEKNYTNQYELTKELAYLKKLAKQKKTKIE